MASDPGLSSFGRTAKSLSRSPLGVIALFLVLVYGIAALVLGLGRDLSAWDRSALVIFFAGFPVLVLGCFYLLVSRHSTKLYAPSDFTSDDAFLSYQKALPPNVASLPELSAQEETPAPNLTELPSVLSSEAHAVEGVPAAAGDLNDLRETVYQSQRRVFLVHTLVPSKEKGQKFDVYLYLVNHPGGSLSSVTAASFFLGKYWGNQVFPGEKRGGTFGIQTAAYGTFLAVCEVTFSDGHKALLQRYVDFEMGNMVRRALLGQAKE